MWIVDVQSESGVSLVLNFQLGESRVANLTIRLFSKDPRKIPELLNKYLEISTQNRVEPITNNELIKTVRTIKFTFTVQFSSLCIENDNIIGIRHGKRPWTTLQELRGQYRMTRISYIFSQTVHYILLWRLMINDNKFFIPFQILVQVCSFDNEF